jgi:hypothetical protein
MPDAKPNPIIHVLPSLTDVAFLMPLIFMFTKLDGARALLGDGDTGWHIRTGEWILANHQVPRHDIFSFTKPGQPWFAWEWLSDVIFGWLHQHWGLAGVVFLGMLILCFTFGLLYRLISRKCGHPLIAIAFTYLAVASSSIHWHARPHLFTLLFVVVFLHILDRVQDGRARLLFLLPVLTVPWTNLHGGFFVGIFLIGCYAAGEFIAWFVGPDPAAGRAALKRAAVYAGTAAACGVASLLNPYTYHLHVFIAQYLRAPFLDKIGEFMSLSFRSSGAIYFEMVLLASVALIGWNLVRRRFAQVIMLAAWAHLSLVAQRNIPILAIVAAPLASQSLDEVLATVSSSGIAGRLRRYVCRFIDLGSEIAENERAWRIYALSVLISVGVGFTITHGVSASKLDAHFDQDRFPVKVLPVLPQDGSGKIFTSDQWGDYLIYRMYPEVRVYMDGRSDFYGNEFVNEYSKIMSAFPGWEKTLMRYNVNRVLLPVNESLVSVLKVSSQWRVVYDDHKCILFERTKATRADQDSVATSRRSGCDPCVAVSPGRDPKVTANSNRDLRVTSDKSL